jgi:hypothetical protein
MMAIKMAAGTIESEYLLRTADFSLVPNSAFFPNFSGLMVPKGDFVNFFLDAFMKIVPAVVR